MAVALATRRRARVCEQRFSPHVTDILWSTSPHKVIGYLCGVSLWLRYVTALSSSEEIHIFQAAINSLINSTQ